MTKQDWKALSITTCIGGAILNTLVMLGCAAYGMFTENPWAADHYAVPFVVVSLACIFLAVVGIQLSDTFE